MRDEVEEVAEGVNKIQMSQISPSPLEKKAQTLIILYGRATLERFQA